MPVNIPTWKQAAANRPPMRSSIEGLNQEIERLVLKGTKSGSHDQEREEEKTYQLTTPEGHRAPLPDMLRSTRSRSVNTQTPAAGDLTTHSSQSSGWFYVLRLQSLAKAVTSFSLKTDNEFSHAYHLSKLPADIYNLEKILNVPFFQSIYKFSYYSLLQGLLLENQHLLLLLELWNCLDHQVNHKVSLLKS